MASPGLSEIVTTTLRHRTGKLADNMSNNNMIIAHMSKRGSMDPCPGGRTIVQELEYADNGNATYYSGAESLPIAPQDIATAAEFDWKQIAVAITFHGLETEVQNTGDDGLIKIVSMRVKNAEKSGQNLLATGMYSNGTAFSGKQVGGLQLLVADDPTTGTVGGINRATAGNEFWRNQVYDISTSGSGAASAANIQMYMQNAWMPAVRGTDKPDLVMADNNFYQHFWQSLTAIQRITKESEAGSGFKTIEFNGIPVVMDGGQGGACPTNHMYFLNTEYLKYRPHSGRNWTSLNKQQSINSDATVQFLVWAGNMTGSNLSLSSVLCA